MSAILRNNAATQGTSNYGRTIFGRGGGGDTAILGRGKIGPKFRHAKDPAGELMPAAEFLGFEPDFRAILEDFEGSPFDPARRRILGKLAGVFAMDYQGARREERAFLRRLLVASNAKEGYAANRALHLLGTPPTMRRTLAIGVAEPVVPGATEGFLGCVQARTAATTFRLLGPKSRALVWQLLSLAGTDRNARALARADRVIERAVILKAVAARRSHLGPWSATGQRQLDEIVTFAEGIRGASRQELARFVTSANPGWASLSAYDKARASVDPVVAWKLFGAPTPVLPLQGDDATSDEDPLGAMDSNPLQERTRLHYALAEARRYDRALSSQQADYLAAYLAGKTLTADELAEKERALGIVGKQAFDVAGADAVDAIRRDAQGTYRFDAARALGDLLSRYSGATYVRRLFSDELTAGRKPHETMGVSLTMGMSVPFVLMGIRNRLMRSFVAVTVDGADEAAVIDSDEFDEHTIALPALAQKPPAELGADVRAEMYFAPAALDLLAPPFGFAMPAVGIRDQL